MNAFALSSLLILISCFILSIFVYFKGKNDKAAIVFSLFSLIICFWGWGGYKVATALSKDEAFFWWQISFVGISCPVVYTHFVLTFLKLNRKFILFIIYTLALIFLLVNFFAREIFLGNIRFVFNEFYWIDWTKYKSPIYLFFYISFYCVNLLYLFVLLFKEYKKSAGFRRRQLKYLIIASFLGWSGAHCNFLPAFGIDIYPYANFFVVIWAIVIAYTILRHKLLNIEIIIKKTIIFTGIFISVYAIFAFFAFLGQIFFERFVTANRWIAMIPSVIVVTIMLRPLENLLINVTDKYLFQKKYDYRELLKTFTSEVLTVLDLDRLVKLTEEKLVQIMKLEYARVKLGRKLFSNADSRRLHADKRRYSDDNLRESALDLRESALKEVALTLPISINNQDIGTLLLGKKKSDEDYTQDDLAILQPLARALGIAISNAKLIDELEKAQAEIAQKEKMATIGTLAAGMAHEIRNPITTIRVFSEYVPDRLSESDFRNKYRDITIKEVDKIDHIIQTLIDFSGKDSAIEIESVSLEEAIDELVTLIGVNKAIEGRIRVEKEIPRDISKIRVNRKELDEIILNLTENAIYAIEGKGQITFKAEEKGDVVELSIADTGCGMSEDIVKNIFNPFFTTRSKGFGLGLFVVNQLVKRNDGNVVVESILGEGSSFKLSFKKANL